MKTHNPSSYSLRRNTLIGLVGITSLLTGSLQLSANTIYTQDFSAGRPGWYNSTSSGGLLVTGGGLKSINTYSRFLTHFDATTLSVGESLNVSFDLKVEAPFDRNDWSFRIGIMDSEGANQVSADDYGSSTDFTNYGGYRINTNIATNGTGVTYFAERSDNAGSLLGTPGSTSLANSANGVNLDADTWYSTQFTFTRTDSTTLDLSFSLNGVTLLDTDTTASTFRFDTLAFYEGDVNSATYVDNVLITTIPEPSTITMVGAAFLLVGLYFKRR
ncbi:hypothetical protein P0Y35_07180 [Kiritimatiellaeota bacterium B1221]|nr:hypothetical protein [Kiritimatiellaeota bacterium B1221]